MKENDITTIIIGICIDIHKQLGPGLFESVYEEVLAHELRMNNLYFERQKPIPIVYDSIKMDVGFIADIIVENKVILELKSVEKINNVHKKQLLTYLRLSGIKLGLLINFNESLLKSGITRIVNNL